jgi:DNA-binding MarR family transcriptional regulator/N-acetylglutamate synthase-like GNAT family acetyltransferase
MPSRARTIEAPNPNDPVQAVRRFNRFYTRQIGVLQEHLLKSQLSLTEVRVLYELAHRENLTAVELRQELGLDRGYLSRMLQNFEKQGWIKTTTAPADRRRIFLELTSKGQKVFAPLDRRSSDEVAAMLAKLSAAEQKRLFRAMQEIEDVLGRQLRSAETPIAAPSWAKAPEVGPDKARPEAVRFQNTFADEITGEDTSSTRTGQGRVSRTPLAVESFLPKSEGGYIFRQHRPGDLGWVVQRHGELYWQEYKYDERFEALVAEIVAEFIQNLDHKRERCWIAEKDGERVGAIFLVKKSKTVAKLRLLLVEPGARGFGLGKRLVSECVNFGRQAGYKEILLWTQSELHAARHLYEQAGFKRIAQEPHRSWGRKDLVAETWELRL